MFGASASMFMEIASTSGSFASMFAGLGSKSGAFGSKCGAPGAGAGVSVDSIYMVLGVRGAAVGCGAFSRAAGKG